MVDRQQLLVDLKPLVRALEEDLRARCDEASQINANLLQEYDKARSAGRSGAAFEEWRADLITQVAVAWVLSCAFARFLEDNALIDPPRISGPQCGGTNRLQDARDQRELYFKSHPTNTDRDYLLSVFDDLAKLPGTKDVFGSHNPALAAAYRNWLSGDAAQQLIEFFQKIDADGTGELVHDFTDESWDTRFLGDLYQDLSEATRKKYALLQTPVFVEEFILERTLEPAIREFGLDAPPIKDGSGQPITSPGIRIIDPACGSGHFLLGGFARVLKHWRAREPGANERELVKRALAAVHGVDLNPYAVAIARFRLLLAAMRECHIVRIKDAPAFSLNLVCGDSLLHGIPGTEQQLLGFHELAHAYQTEDLSELHRLLAPRQYHTVVGNPPYITPKDRMLNAAYRERYPSACHMKYSLSAPFMQRLFELAVGGGFVGQITANSFMKREFGKKLIEEYLPRIDMTHVIDTQLAHIPEHGTATVILLGRHQIPVAPTVRVVSGLRREDHEPDPPESGKVWQAILAQVDLPGSQSEFVSVADVQRQIFQLHPWSIGGGGAAELKETLDGAAEYTLESIVDVIGPASFAGVDEVFVAPKHAFRRKTFPRELVSPFFTGEDLREWSFVDHDSAFTPYDQFGNALVPCEASPWYRCLWNQRSVLQNVTSFGGQTRQELGETWWTWYRWIADRVYLPIRVAFAFVATHNQFAVAHGTKIFNRSVPIIKLRSEANEDDYRALVGLLNSAAACFWMKQVFYDKGGGGISEGVKAERWERFLEHDGTKIRRLPIPHSLAAQDSSLRHCLVSLSRAIDGLASQRTHELPNIVVAAHNGCAPGAVVSVRPRARSEAQDTHVPPANRSLLSESAVGVQGDQARSLGDALKLSNVHAEMNLFNMIALQEELDWLSYRAYGLLDDSAAEAMDPPPVKLGERAFEIVMARRIEAGMLRTEWFRRHGSEPLVGIPEHWPEAYKKVVKHRIGLIEANKEIGLIEQPEYKRRWNMESWGDMQERALRGWLLDRLECYFDLDGRMNDRKGVTAHGDMREPRLTCVAKVADLASADKDFMQVAELFTGRMDFDVSALVGELVAAESVPALPVSRYKPAAMDKRRAWERTWELQRLEDAVDAVFDVERLKKIEPSKAEVALRSLVSAMRIDEQAKPQVLQEAVGAAGYVSEAVKQTLNLNEDTILKPIRDAARRARNAAVGDIPAPRKYSSADFQTSDYWRLRGKLDVPKERWVSFPNCEGEDGTLVIAWAGYDHAQMTHAITEHYELVKERQGRILVPLLACIGQLIPWLKQWHNEPDPNFGGTRMGDEFENYLAEEAKALGMSVEQVLAWTPPPKVNSRGRKKKAARSETAEDGDSQ